jgi:hypothetical protein
MLCNALKHDPFSYNVSTSLPTCFPSQIYCIASSASSNGRVESIISEKVICVAVIAAHRSSMSCFEPALIPLYESVSAYCFFLKIPVIAPKRYTGIDVAKPSGQRKKELT